MGRNKSSRHAALLRFTRNTGMAAFSFRKDNHSACAGRQGFGGGAYQQAFADVIIPKHPIAVIHHAFPKLQALTHRFHIDVFHCRHIIPVRNLSAQLMQVVLTLIPYFFICKLCLGGKVCRKQLESIPSRSTVDCTGLPRFHDEPPVIADECSGSIHAILSTCVHRWRRANTAQGAEGGDSAN